MKRNSNLICEAWSSQQEPRGPSKPMSGPHSPHIVVVFLVLFWGPPSQTVQVRLFLPR